MAAASGGGSAVRCDACNTIHEVSAALSGRTHPPVCDRAIAIVAWRRGVPPCVKSNSAVAAPHSNVPVPGRALFATKLNC